jgi:putative transposase
MENEYYLLSGRPAKSSDGLFRDAQDYARFLFLILHFQSPTPIQNIGFYTRSYLRKNRFSLGEDKVRKITKNRQVELGAFALTPGYYHLLLRNAERHSVSAYMHRVLMAYGKYFNAKYGRTGHVFDGPYRAMHLPNKSSILEASRHVHTSCDPGDPFSSHEDYFIDNRWGELLKTNLVLTNFKSADEYSAFLLSPPEKESSLMLDY